MDASRVIGKLGTYKFGALEYDCVSLNKMDKEHTEIVSLSLV